MTQLTKYEQQLVAGYVVRIKELEDFVQAEGAVHYSHREFEKMEAERDSWRDVAASTAADVKMLYEAAKDFHQEYKSEAFGEIAYEELEKALDFVKSGQKPLGICSVCSSEMVGPNKTICQVCAGDF